MGHGEQVRLQWATRRQVLRTGGSAVLATLAGAGCSFLETDPATNGQGERRGGPKGEEAPVLAERVAQGDIPPVADRLPVNPMVVEPVEKSGVYGGTWHNPLEGPDLMGWATRTAKYEGLVRWRRNWSGAAGTGDVIPNVAESVDANADGTEYVFVLREGLRWSDGEPFTADDVVFAQNDVFNDKVLTPEQKNHPTATKLDDYTVRFTFQRPNALFLQDQATLSGTALVNKPRHYLEKFHKKYNADVASIVDSEGSSDWAELFFEKADVWRNVDLPSILPWLVTRPAGEGTRLILERNPYYWKTDPDGSQLPYIDRIIYELAADPQVRLLNASNGEFDMYARDICTGQNKPVLAKNRDKGGYGFFTTKQDNMNEMILMLNFTHRDPVKRRLFQARDFRVGLSHAINREEIIAAAYQRQGRPAQVAPRPEDELFDEEMATQYTEYDPALANEYLDKVSPEKDPEGFRLDTDGKRISFSISFPTYQKAEFPEVLELVKGYWREVGIEMRPKAESYNLWLERIDANEQEGLVWIGDTGYSASILLEPRYFLPAGFNLFCVPWRMWYDTGGRDGERPPSAMLKQLELYDQVKATTKDDEQASLLAEILQIAKEQFYTIGTVLPAPGYGIVKNNFHNVLDGMIEGWQYPIPGPTDPQQYYITPE